jgi:hypothetical protein
VTVDDKPLLRKISLFGMTYTMFLEERGRPNEVGALIMGGNTFTFLNGNNGNLTLHFYINIQGV